MYKCLAKNSGELCVSNYEIVNNKKKKTKHAETPPKKREKDRRNLRNKNCLFFQLSCQVLSSLNLGELLSL